MLYELRLYSVAPGRMADVHSRFNTHLPALFARHGVRCVGAWTALAGPASPRFVYLMAYSDYAEREAVWQRFYEDPEWWRIRAETNAGHEMIEQHDLFFLKPNPAWQPGADTVIGPDTIYELVLQQVAPGQGAAANEFLRDHYLPALREAGAQVLGVMDFASGTNMPRIAMLQAWNDAASCHQGHLSLEKNTAISTDLCAQRTQLGNPILGRSEVNLLQLVPGVAFDHTILSC